ncbi:hypothetical protein BOX15_Mlig033773g1 [Macrostomum lignano]|uniref:Uncharacterized protein n=1 Tax=Macrostomum lignano TaxID=282301 RepID=A0A267GPE0_9PLAT|nr:hypothetical protein BOX15_Mlig033773g1 [Macrostomum lignano]
MYLFDFQNSKITVRTTDRRRKYMASAAGTNKIYFAAAVSATIQHLEAGKGGIRPEKDMWRTELYEHIKTKGEVTNPDLWDDVLKKTSEGDNKPNDVYTYSVTDGVLKSSHVVAEVSRLSHGVGMEIGMAIASGIPVLCLYRVFNGDDFAPPDNLSRMIRGAPVTVVEYGSVREAKEAIDRFFDNKK